MSQKDIDNEAFARMAQKWLGLPVDGWAGQNTHLAFRAKTGAAAPTPPIAHALTKPSAFFATVKASFGPLSQTQVDGFNALLSAMKSWPLQWAAYGLATAWHETATKMQPIHEFGGNAYLSKYDTGSLAAALGNTPAADGDGQIFAGRGYVQITGRRNYRAFGIEATPDDALKPDVAARIMVDGMEKGVFTGKGLKSYPLGAYSDYRRIINGQDQAAKIADYASRFELALGAGGW